VGGNRSAGWERGAKFWRTWRVEGGGGTGWRVLSEDVDVDSVGSLVEIGAGGEASLENSAVESETSWSDGEAGRAREGIS
jgi:hypothetical protein